MANGLTEEMMTRCDNAPDLIAKNRVPRKRTGRKGRFMGSRFPASFKIANNPIETVRGQRDKKKGRSGYYFLLFLSV